MARIAPACHWTADIGGWNFGPDGTRPWNGVDNGWKGIASLRDFLIKTYRKAKSKYDNDASAA